MNLLPMIENLPAESLSEVMEEITMWRELTTSIVALRAKVLRKHTASVNTYSLHPPLEKLAGEKRGNADGL